MTIKNAVDPKIRWAVVLLFAASCALIACQSGRPNPSSGMLSSSSKARVKSAANDYTQPYLTDQKMQQFIASMKEEHNPLELLFKQGGAAQNPATLGERLNEFNSFAHKYGFDDYQDYSAVWGRILAGEMQLWAADMMKESAKTFEKMIADAQADLKKPNLAPEMRKADEDMIASNQKALDDMNKNSSKNAVNATDMELIRKYKDQIDEAEKKYKSGTTTTVK